MTLDYYTEQIKMSASLPQKFSQTAPSKKYAAQKPPTKKILIHPRIKESQQLVQQYASAPISAKNKDKSNTESRFVFTNSIVTSAAGKETSMFDLIMGMQENSQGQETQHHQKLFNNSDRSRPLSSYSESQVGGNGGLVQLLMKRQELGQRAASPQQQVNMVEVVQDLANIVENINQQAKYQMIHRTIDRKKPSNQSTLLSRQNQAQKIEEMKQHTYDIATHSSPGTKCSPLFKTQKGPIVNPKKNRQLRSNHTIYEGLSSSSSRGKGSETSQELRDEDVPDEYTGGQLQSGIQNMLSTLSLQGASATKSRPSQTYQYGLDSSMKKNKHILNEALQKLKETHLSRESVQSETRLRSVEVVPFTTANRAVTSSNFAVHTTINSARGEKPPLHGQQMIRPPSSALYSYSPENNLIHTTHPNDRMSVTQFLVTSPGTAAANPQSQQKQSKFKRDKVNQNQGSRLSLSKQPSLNASKTFKSSTSMSQHKGIGQKKKKPLPFDGKVISLQESQKIVERLMKHEEKKRDKLFRAQQEREEKELRETQELNQRQVQKVDKSHARQIFSRLQNDVEERKRKEEEALTKRTHEIEDQLKTLFKPKINNPKSLLSKTQTSITFHSASRMGMMNIIREESPHSTTQKKHYNYGKTHHMYRSSDTLLKLNLAQVPLPEQQQPSPTQFEQMYLTSNSTDNINKKNEEDLSERYSRVLQIRQQLRERHAARQLAQQEQSMRIQEQQETNYFR
ncbi:hypothetical protein FGO68_gene10932 [Halteria grandinella]|uniref:Uncharacterized protein n=1 Tax=Halteria grandinella TaxID=5974 RepID=A0A8J8NVD4_HALGN|nr:hypothetical protein FGO68_gene10932 [Halteria grandinella]